LEWDGKQSTRMKWFQRKSLTWKKMSKQVVHLKSKRKRQKQAVCVRSVGPKQEKNKKKKKVVHSNKVVV
jgi:hypothetical protein